MNGRLGNTAVVASSTETSRTLFDLLIAIPAPSGNITAATLNGTYWVATLELPSGSFSNVRDGFFQVNANGSGGFGNVSITGETFNTGSRVLSQAAAGSTYSLNADGTGTANFPAPASMDASGLVLSGTKNLYVSQDGSIFIGGGTTTGSQGMIVGIKSGSSSGNSNLSGLYFGGGIDTAGTTISSFVGSANATGNGNLVWSRRYLQSGDPNPLNITALNNYSITSNGSGYVLADSLAISANGNFFIASGVSPLGPSQNFEFVFGVKAPSVSGTGVFLNPMGVFNAASYAPAGNPISSGELITLYGTGFPAQTAVASSLPLPTTLANVQVLLNGTAIPIFSVTPDHVSAIVPYGIRGSTATITVSSGGKQSNQVVVPVASTSPGIFSATSNGLGSGAILHADYSLVSAANPAKRGETVLIYLTGLGSVNPAVADGTAAPVNPLAVVTGPVAVFINGVQATVTYQGLAPQLAALYQLNAVIPDSAGVGSLPLAVQTADSFTDLADIVVSESAVTLLSRTECTFACR